MRILQLDIKYLFITLLFSIATLAEYGQSGNESDMQQKVKQQATKMGQFLIVGDYKDFALCTYPKLLNMIGGKDKMILIVIMTHKILSG